MAVYSASKAYVLSLGEAINFELRGTGVTLTVVCPGAARTGFADVANTAGSELFVSPVAFVLSSAEVARVGYRALAEGKRVVVVGLVNKIIAASGRFSPRLIQLPVTSAILKPGK
jgi:hypothetical protein